ncbi:hypothetical protein CBS11852_10765 [Aspergillus niger]|nr:hypothetical protein CBS11852_10765 [Aspergillus niger]KAI2984383.1 hypothetical protein CBS147344_7025 [Aspergillus niger]
MAPTQQRSLWATLTAVLVFLMQATPTSGAGFTWYVKASSAIAGIAWMVCGYFLPASAGTGCIAAALLVGINAVVQAHGGSGQTGAMIPAKRDEGSIAFNHITHEGVVHNFINTTALTHDWHFVHAVNQPVNLTVRRLSDGRIHARTQGFSNMPCTDNCPSEDLAAKVLESRATTSHVQEIDFSWTEPSGYGTKTQTGLAGAASGAAQFVASQPSGTFSFCSDAYSVDGLDAVVGFNFYGDNYATDFPPPCD